MNQILHIFRKDTRRFWLEILASLAAVWIFVVHAPTRWTFSPSVMRTQEINQLLPLLVPGVWWLLIARVIQAESLVGDRQFWLTRPYEWKKLLAAKALFIAVWVYVPFLLMTAAILKLAGFAPLSHSAGWWSSLATFSGYVVLPVIAIAVITSNFVRLAVTLVGCVAASIVASYLISRSPGGYESALPNDHHMWMAIILIVGAVIAIPLQYATRKVWIGRAVVLGAAVLAFAVGMTLTALRESEISRVYPANGGPSVQLALRLGWKTVQVVPSERAGMVYVDVPIDFSGVAEGKVVELDDVKITIDDAASGWHWTAPWWSSQIQHIVPGMHHGSVEIMLSREQLKRIVQGSATVRLTVAVSELQAVDDTTAAITPNQDFAVSGFGVCSARESNHFSSLLNSQLLCRSALGEPPLTHVSATWYPVVCTEETNVPNDPVTETAWSGATAELSRVEALAPVQPVLVNLNPDWHNGDDLYRTRGFSLCPGTVAHFTRYFVIGRTQASVTVPNSYFRYPRGFDDRWLEP